MLAAQMLAEGHDAPALRRAAGYSRRDDPRDIRQEFGQALEELGAWLPGPRRRRAGSRHVPGARTAQRRPDGRRVFPLGTGHLGLRRRHLPGTAGWPQGPGANVPPARHRALRSEWRRRAAAARALAARSRWALPGGIPSRRHHPSRRAEPPFGVVVGSMSARCGARRSGRSACRRASGLPLPSWRSACIRCGGRP